MSYSRRDLNVFIGAVAATAAADAQKAVLPSKMLKYEDFPVRTNGANFSRAMIQGIAHSGFPFDMHETDLPAGGAPHPPHHHEHEEMVMIREGTLEVTISGKKSTLGPGSVIYAASNEEHGWRNVGTTRAKYFVMAFGRPVV
ncbi:MAG: cupin domain-containing protein [Bryobacterales bacterium]|nr:cupin domain-containing protein [Bryobacterales bacterium]